MVELSSVYPSAPHDRYVAEVALARTDLETRWIDGREAFIFPNTADARLVVPAGAPLDPLFQEWAGRHAERITERPNDFDPYFDIYRW